MTRLGDEIYNNLTTAKNRSPELFTHFPGNSLRVITDNSPLSNISASDDWNTICLEFPHLDDPVCDSSLRVT